MIGWLCGKPRELSADRWVINVSGVGYEVCCVGDSRLAAAEAMNASNEVELFIHTDVKEDAIQLYGFSSLQDRRVFLLLLSVKGVGARLAAQILGALSARELLRAIGLRDNVQLQRIKGVGKKTAERISVELSDRVGEMSSTSLQADGQYQVGATQSLSAQEMVVEDAKAALRELGFPTKEIDKVLNELAAQHNSKDAGEYVRLALSKL